MANYMSVAQIWEATANITSARMMNLLIPLVALLILCLVILMLCCEKRRRNRQAVKSEQAVNSEQAPVEFEVIYIFGAAPADKPTVSEVPIDTLTELFPELVKVV